MFESCGSSLNSESGSIDGSNSDTSFPSIFLVNRTIMAISTHEPQDAREVKSSYTTDDDISLFVTNLLFLLPVRKKKLFWRYALKRRKPI